MAKSKKSIPAKGYKRLQCKYCDHVSERVDVNADAITCYKCVTKLLNGEVLEIRK
jgi:hypothetical protein